MFHKLDEKTLVTKHLLDRFADEAATDEGNGNYYAIIQMDDGLLVEHNPHSPEADDSQKLFGRDMLSMLNKNINHDGAWVIVFTHPAPFQILKTTTEYQRFAFMWLDEDGNVQFAFDWIANNAADHKDFSDCLLMGADRWTHKCEHAWTQWHWAMRQVLAPTEDQMINRAKGQQATQSFENAMPDHATIQ